MNITRAWSSACLSLLTAATLAAADAPPADPGAPIGPLPPGIDLRAATVKVIVAPDHRDWTYKIGEPAHFSVSVTADSEPLDNVSVTYTVGPDMYPGVKKTVALPLSGLSVDGGTMAGPGFLRCIGGSRPPRLRPSRSSTRRSSRRTSTRFGTRARRSSRRPRWTPR